MDIYAIFGLQFVMSVLVFVLLAKWFVWPWVTKHPIPIALTILLLPHAFRHIGLSFLVPGLVAADIPSSFASGAAYGDLASAVLAIIAMLALRTQVGIGIAIVWVFNIVGTIDLLTALPQHEAVPYFRAAWYIPTFLVPLLLVSHVMIFKLLFRRLRIAASPA